MPDNERKLDILRWNKSIHKVDKEGKEFFDYRPSTVADDNNGPFQYGTDEVLAPLQNFIPPVEEFEGTCAFGNEGGDPHVYARYAIENFHLTEETTASKIRLTYGKYFPTEPLNLTPYLGGGSSYTRMAVPNP